jgi:hypothetical protein
MKLANGRDFSNSVDDGFENGAIIDDTIGDTIGDMPTASKCEVLYSLKAG